MGARGPIPQRESALARPRARKGKEQVPVTRGTARPVSWPEGDPAWHPIADFVWRSAQESGQADFYQQSDIAILFSLCDDLSNYKLQARRSAQLLQTVMAGLGDLLLTEGQRRRVRIELDEPVTGAKSASVTAIESYRKELLA